MAAVPGISIAGTFDTGDAPVWDGSQWVATDVATASELSSHESDTTAVHGIADTSVLLNTSTVFAGDVAGTAGALRVRRQLALAAQGIKDAVGDSAAYATGTSPGTSVEVGRLVGAFDGETVTGVVVKLISITGLSLTNAYVSAYTTSGVQLAVSADIKASLSSTGLLALPFTGTFVKSGSGGFYVTFKQTGATLATVARASAAVAENGVNSGVAGSIARTGVTGVPDTPASFSANANGWWLGWY